MEWKLFANLAETAGQKEIEVAVDPGATVGDALDALLDSYPDLREEVMADGEIADHIRLLHNGDAPDAGRATTLDAGDELALFPPVSGG